MVTWAVVGLIVAGVALLLWWRPIYLVRLLVWLVTHTVYRVRVFGRENVPKTGAALLVCNHVSYVDWLLLLAGQKRIIRFVIFAGWTHVWGVRHLLRWAGVIPINAAAGPRAIVKSLRQAGEALARGELVCIFAEGRFTRTGFLLPFHRGFEKIVEQTPAAVVPVCLDHVWGSIFSFRHGRLIWKRPQELPYPVSVAYGPPMSPTTTAVEVRQAIQKLSADCAVERSKRRRPVHRQFVRIAARHPFRTCFIDTTPHARVLRYAEALAGAMLLARRLRPLVGDDRMVGVWLPAGVGAALANIALALLGRTSVNLNYTSSAEAVASAVKQCGVRRVMTARAFVARVPFRAEAGAELVYVEELLRAIPRGRQIRAFLTVVLLPAFVLDRWVLRLSNHRPDDALTVIFSSGSTGDPKGVMLNHRNVGANAESMIQAIDPGPRDRLLGVLPFFHSFGFTVTLWVPLLVGASAVYHADPRQAREVGDLCRKYACTIFLTTPTFLRLYLRRCDPGDFRSLRLLVTGAEKLSTHVAEEFREKFGILPLECYGATELSPAATANVPDREQEGFRQIGNKPGTVGQPLPGLAARVVDADTFEPLPAGREGLVLVYGPNVMAGYLGRPEATKEVTRDGWYVTGDMARMDEDGFITITDRLSRFSKIGGEMVPHQKVEDELHAVLGTSDRAFAVTSVPDEKKGERLVVLHVPLEGTGVHEVWQKLGARGLPNLWVPAERDFFPIPELPVLGSGKVDLKRVRELARERAGA